MTDIVLSKLQRKAILTELKTSGMALDGLKMLLFSNDIVPNEDSAYADLTPASFTGYALSGLLVWDDPSLSFDTGDWVLRAHAIEFRSASGSPYVSGTAYGYALILPGTPNVLIATKRFDTPFIFDVPDRLLTVVAELPGTTLIAA